MTDDELKALRSRLKSGEYDGTDIMSAWLALDDLIAERKRSPALPPSPSPKGASMSEVELPEPVAWVLGGLGMAALVIDRRHPKAMPVYTAEQVRQVLAAEREKCAVLADKFNDPDRNTPGWESGYNNAAVNIAAAIRKG